MAHFNLKLKLFILVTIIYAIGGAIGGVLLGLFIPEDYFGLYPTISILYWVLGLILTFGLDHRKRTNPDRLMNYFMLIKAIKFLLTILYLMLYVTYDPDVKMQFSVTLMCNYFIYSLLEMYIFNLYNKKLIDPTALPKNEE